MSISLTNRGSSSRQRSRLCPVLVAVAALLLGAGTAFATVESTTTYDVAGCQLSEVWADIEDKGPRDSDGVHAGEAETKLSISTMPDIKCQEVEMRGCEPDNVGYECRAVLDVTYALKTTITLPNWTGADDACAEAKAEWDRFLEKLTEHEKGHDTRVQKALDDAKPKTHFESDAFRDCDQAKAREQAAAAQAALDKELETELKRLADVMEKANKDYDDETNHGATQGATLDTSIKCDKPATPKEQLEEIHSDLDFLDPEGLRKQLQAKLANAVKSIEKGNTSAAKGQINAFIKAVKAQRGKKIDEEVADDMIERATAARDGL